ncbi:unnamed protein product [Medioppia subpectinata]|uniref:VPS37 C-terminal domain-containing protein n=1 Tax=Medioppia subpectinata TaxID=1979941 RepID=A0A7R9PU42_9ACAR|nr:unnamed protein product [Medioppia subpectinata]CAG2100796.1 unnamed protein product [Medioppia subpectinata]
MSYSNRWSADVDISSVTALVNQLSNEELRQLVNDQNCQQLDHLIKDLPQLRSLESERDRLIEANKSSAELNLSREPTYRQTRQQLIDGHNELKGLKQELDAKKSRLSEVSRQTSLDTRLALMQAAAAEAEEESEEIATAFVEQKLDFDSFIKEFIDKRKLSHLRRIKTDKMMDFNRSASSAANLYAPQRPAPPPPASLPFASSAANPHNMPPYPIYAPQMMPTPPQQSYPYSHQGFR